jgi:phosphorylcholine metabolism protein LicD
MLWRYTEGEIIPIVIPKHYYENLDSINFQGIEFKIPSNVEQYLEYRYGKDWKTPKKDYVYWIDDGTIKKDWIIKDEELI